MDSVQDRGTGDQNNETVVIGGKKMNRAKDSGAEEGRDLRVVKEIELKGLGD